MTTYYHVASAQYEDGDDLRCWSQLVEAGIISADDWKWDGEPVDTDVVCLFDTLAEAEDMREEWLPDGRILRIEIPEDDTELTLTRVEEGFTAVLYRIPASYITVA